MKIQAMRSSKHARKQVKRHTRTVEIEKAGNEAAAGEEAVEDT